MNEPTRHAAVVPISAGLMEDVAAFNASLTAWWSMPAEERAARQQEAAVRREEERSRAKRVAPSLTAVAERMGWGPRFVEHLCQPYCYCDIGLDGLDRCIHAADLNILSSD